MEERTKVTICIPDDVSFADLKLARDKGGITFDMAPIRRICEASGIDVAMFTETPEDNLSSLIVEWYGRHLKNGGARDLVQDQLLQEILAEDYTKLKGRN